VEEVRFGNRLMTTMTCDILPPIIAAVRPKTSTSLIFPQCVGADVMEQYDWPRHAVLPIVVVVNSIHYEIRSNLLFAEIASDTEKWSWKKPQIWNELLLSIAAAVVVAVGVVDVVIRFNFRRIASK
jgi:hypothetical protein